MITEDIFNELFIAGFLFGNFFSILVHVWIFKRWWQKMSKEELERLEKDTIKEIRKQTARQIFKELEKDGIDQWGNITEYFDRIKQKWLGNKKWVNQTYQMELERERKYV